LKPKVCMAYKIRLSVSDRMSMMYVTGHQHHLPLRSNNLTQAYLRNPFLHLRMKAPRLRMGRRPILLTRPLARTIELALTKKVASATLCSRRQRNRRLTHLLVVEFELTNMEMSWKTK